MAQSSIEWTERTWNPLVGCSRVSTGCERCYAETMAARINRMSPKSPYQGLIARSGQWNGKLRFLPERLRQPSSWKPSIVFVNSMSDLFHENADQRDIFSILYEMAANGQHVFQALTKRPQRMQILLDRWFTLNTGGLAAVGKETQQTWTELGIDTWMRGRTKHIWLGVSIESQETMFRAEMLPIIKRGLPFGGVLWASLEPLIGRLSDMEPLRPLDWVVVGGESGKGARPMQEEWLAEVIEACRAMQVPVFVKQMGTALARRMGLKGKGGKSMLDWPPELRVREWPRGQNL